MSETLQEQAARLYVSGVFGYKSVGKRLGVSSSTVRRWLDPERAERDRRLSREAKVRRKRICACGESLSYDNDGGLCTRCISAARRIWTRETIIAAIQEWAKEHGRPPSATEWKNSGSGSHPATSSVYRSQHASAAQNQPFASWAEAIEAAGFERPETGGRYRERPWLWKFDHEEAQRLIDSGLTRHAVAVRLGVAPISIYELMKRGGSFAQRRTA